MARLGLLMLRQGKWRDRQIIPAEWVRRSTSVKQAGNKLGEALLDAVKQAAGSPQ